MRQSLKTKRQSRRENGAPGEQMELTKGCAHLEHMRENDAMGKQKNQENGLLSWTMCICRKIDLLM
jgi:hypothetical protein